MSIIKIPIGDWSDDGHGKCDIYEIESNYPALVLQEAYKASCKLTGVQFNHNENYTGIEGLSNRNNRYICTQYEDNSMSWEAYEILKGFGLKMSLFFDCDDDFYDEDDLDDDFYFECTKHFTQVLLWFIGLSMPKDWEWSFLEIEGEYLNGFWNGNLNVQFGYGLFY